MSFLAKLIMWDQEYDLLHADFLYYKLMDCNGASRSNTLGGFINLSMTSGPNDDRFLQWMIGTDDDRFYDLEDGEIRFLKDTWDGLVEKRYRFQDAACIRYHETFSAGGENAMITSLTISPAIQDYGRLMTKSWMETKLETNDPAPIREEEILPRIIDFYFTDLRGRRNRKIKAGKKIYLVIRSRGKIGKKVTIKFQDKVKQYEYKGKLIQDHFIRNYEIQSNLDRIPLKIIS